MEILKQRLKKLATTKRKWLPWVIVLLVLIVAGAGYFAYRAKTSPDRPINSITKVIGKTPGELVGKKAEFKKVLIKKAGDQDAAFWVYDAKSEFSTDKAVLVFLNFFLEAKIHRENDVAPLSDGLQITVTGKFKETPNPEEIYTFWKVPVPDAEAAGKKGIYLEAESVELIK